MTSLIWTDKATTQDRLGFDDYRRTLVRVIQGADTPIVVGIFGRWGSGKTSLMMMMRQDLDQAKAQTVWFDAWKYDKEEALWRSLLVAVLRELRDRLPEEEEEARKELEELQVQLYQTTDHETLGGAEIDWSQLTKATAKGVVKLSLSFIPSILFLKRVSTGPWADGGDPNAILAALQHERVRMREEAARTLEQFQERFGRAIQRFLEKTGRPFVAIFIDDLDHCLPENAVQVLESIKLFMDVPGCVFILGVDRSVVEKGIETKYAGKTYNALVSGDDYLKTIVQVPFNLPPLERTDIQKFIEAEIRASFPRNLAPIFAAGLEPNPRQIKQTMNVYRLLWTLAEERPGLKRSIVPGLLAKIVVIQMRYPKLYNDIGNYTNLLGDLEDYFEREAAAAKEETARGESEDAASGVAPIPHAPSASHLAPHAEEGTLVGKYVREKALKALLLAGQVRFRDTDIRPYIFLTRTANPQGDFTPEPAIDQKIWEDLLSNDATRLRAALEKVEASDSKGYVKRLLHVIGDAKTYRAPMRVSAGNALAHLGDPRDLTETVVVSEGDFLYGEAKERVRFPRPFRIGKYLVTNLAYKKFVDATGHPVPFVDNDWAQAYNWDQENHTYPEGKGNHPVVLVNWEDAQEYCKWLSSSSGKDYCLPTEQEWERAARATDGRNYPWEGEFDPGKANARESGIGGTSPVGVFPGGASTCGALDMVGNVWEWMDNNLDKDTKVVRGGSWDDGASETRCTSRDGLSPDSRDYNIGFRVMETILNEPIGQPRQGPAGDRGISDPAATRESTDPAGDRESTVPGGNRESLDPAVNRESTDPAGDRESTDPVGDGESTDPAGDLESTGPVGDGGSTGPVGDSGSTDPARSAGSADEPI